jgi:tetratricopeptide (TPR) repeat protein
MIWEAKWSGVGAGHWKIYFPAYGSDIWRARQGMVQFQRPHNDFLWILSELGIIGLVFYLCIFVMALYQAFYTLAQPNLIRSERIFIRLLISGLIAYLLISFFSFPRERIFHQTILFLNLAFVVNKQRPRPIKLSNVKLIVGATSLIMLASLAFALNWWRGESIVLKINRARAEGEWETLLQEHDKLANNYFYQIDAVSLPTSFYAGLAKLNLQDYSSSEQYFEEAYALHPYNIHVINNLANIKLLSNQGDTAIYFYREALKVSPKYLDGALNLMAAYFNSNRAEEAYLVLCEYEKVFEVDDPDHPTLPYYRKLILKAMQDRKFQLNPKKSWSEKELQEAHFQALTEKRKLFN